MIAKVFWGATIAVALYQALELYGQLAAADSAPQQAAAAAMAAAWVIIPYVISRAVSELLSGSKGGPEASPKNLTT